MLRLRAADGALTVACTVDVMPIEERLHRATLAWYYRLLLHLRGSVLHRARRRLRARRALARAGGRQGVPGVPPGGRSRVLPGGSHAGDRRPQYDAV